MCSSRPSAPKPVAPPIPQATPEVEIAPQAKSKGRRKRGLQAAGTKSLRIVLGGVAPGTVRT